MSLINAYKVGVKCLFFSGWAILCFILSDGCGFFGGDRLSFDPDDYPMRFHGKEVQNIPQISIRYLDLDNDGFEEKVSVANFTGATPPCLTADRDDYNIGQVNFSINVKLGLDFTSDVNGDGDKDLWLQEQTSDTLYACAVDIFHSKNSELEKKIILYPIHDTDTTRVAFVSPGLIGIIDDTSTHKRLLICLFQTGLSKSPRGVAAYDIETGEQVWFYPMGSYPTSVDLEDLNGDGVPEILVSTHATNNGSAVHGMNDTHSYIIVLDVSGRPFGWPPKKMGGVGSSTRIFPYEENGRTELLCILSNPKPSKDSKNSISFVDPKNGSYIGNPKEFNSQLMVLWKNPPILHSTKQNIIVAASQDGEISLLNSGLDFLTTKHLHAEISVMGVEDIVGDNRPEIIVLLKSGSTLLLDEHLDPLALIRGSIGSSFTERNGNRGLVVTNEGKTEIGIVEVNMNRWPYRLGLLIGIVMFILAGLYLLYRGNFYLHLYKIVTKESSRLGSLLLNRSGKIVSANENLAQMLHLQSDISKGSRWDAYFTSSGLAPVRTFLMEHARNTQAAEAMFSLLIDGSSKKIIVRSRRVRVGKIFVGSLVLFDDITESIQTDRALNWALVAQNLAHEMKTPLSTIWFTLERIRQQERDMVSGVDETLLKSIEEELRRLDRYVKSVMKLANLNPPNLQETDLETVVCDVLQRYQEKIPAAMRVEKDFASGLPHVKVDVHLFTVALSNIIDNAVAAMKGKGTLKLSTYVAQTLNEHWVCLAAADTGSGIAAADIPKIFNPYFSKSDGGTGLGLVITKKIIEDHGGNIRFTTREGLGTEFIIQLPVFDSAAGDHHA